MAAREAATGGKYWAKQKDGSVVNLRQALALVDTAGEGMEAALVSGKVARACATGDGYDLHFLLAFGPESTGCCGTRPKRYQTNCPEDPLVLVALNQNTFGWQGQVCLARARPPPRVREPKNGEAAAVCLARRGQGPKAHVEWAIRGTLDDGGRGGGRGVGPAGPGQLRGRGAL